MNDSVIHVEGLTRRFRKTLAVDGAALDVPRGSAFGLFGTNGAGKTTTIRCLLGLLEPNAGEVRVLGLDPRRKGVDIRSRTGYVPEEHHFYNWMTVAGLVRFTRAFYPTWDDVEAARLIQRFGLTETKRIRELSKGMVAKLALTLALAHRPELLVLDEPTSGLDPVVRREFVESMIDMIHEEGCTVFISSHLIAEVEGLVDRVAIMKSGRILLTETADRLKESTRRVRMVFENEAPEALPGALVVTRAGHSVEAVYADWSDETAQRLRAELGPIEIVAERMGLEDIFVAHVGQSE